MCSTMRSAAFVLGVCVGCSSAAEFISAHQNSHKQPSPIYQSVSSKVSALEERLSEMEMENKQKLAARQATYQAKLQEQQQQNTELATENVELTKQEEHLAQDNTALKNRGMELQADNQMWEEDWHALQANLSTALELTSKTLTDIEKDRRAKDLEVLSELRTQDEVLQKRSAHSNQLNEVARPHVLGDDKRGFALLAIKASPNPRSIIKVLDAGLQDLSMEYRDDEARLDAQFAQLFNEEKEKYEALREEHGAINQRISERTKLHTRLERAVQHLEESNKDLEQKANSIRMYAQRLGIRSLPRRRVSSKARVNDNYESRNFRRPSDGGEVDEEEEKGQAEKEKEEEDQLELPLMPNAKPTKHVKRSVFSWITG